MGHPVKLSDLQQYLASLQDNDGFNLQFQAIPSGEAAPVTIGKSQAALKKNRYHRIFPYDHSRVKLNADLEASETAEDYINASFIQSYNDTIYIATQAPLLHTIADFWRMVWEQDCPSIVMLAKLVDRGKVNCDQYWPDEETAVYGDIKVTVNAEEKYHSYVRRNIEIQMGDKSKEVKHYQFTCWPDMGVPVSCTGLLAMRNHVLDSHDKTRGPIVLHCSAGVGRTGTYLAIDYLLQQVQQNCSVDVMKCITYLRSYRMNLVETVLQYQFIHEALLEAAEFHSGVSLSCEEFIEGYSVSCDTHTYNIARQYQILNVLLKKHTADQCTESMKTENMDKNRSSDILPGDNLRVSLSDLGTRQSDYINAVHIQSLGQLFPQIVTQMPLQQTVLDFWRLVTDHDITSIVMLNAPLDDLSYMPTEEHAVQHIDGFFTVKNRSTIHGDIIITDLTVEDITRKCEREVQHFQLRSWEQEKDLVTEGALLDLYTRVKEETSKRDGSVLVHCLNGCDRTGIFCAASQILNTVDTHRQIDVFNSVKEIRKYRPDFIVSVEQYQYLWKVVEKYLLKWQK